MKIIKVIKVVSFSLIAGGLVSASVYAKDMDVTMDVVKQSDAHNITGSVMTRIDLPESAQNAGIRGTGDQDRFHRQDRSHADDRNHEASSSWRRGAGEAGYGGESRDWHRESGQDAMVDNHQMRDGMNDTRDTSNQMRNDARDTSNQVRNDARDAGHQMRDNHTMN